jgi:hypothetical protein
MAYILEFALRDPILDEIIHGIELRALSADEKSEILDQQAKMREYLGIEDKRSSLPYPSTCVARFT